MADGKEFTFKDVGAHTTKKDLFMVIHDKVYNASSFVDEHPGGEEVLLDVGGQDATEAFEDVGHSDEAREILDGMHVGALKRVDGDPPAKPAPSATPATAQKPATEGGMGIGVYAVMLVGGVVAFVAYQYFQGKSGQA